jgi:hypothetical protein
VVVHTYNPSTQEAGRLRQEDQSLRPAWALSLYIHIYIKTLLREREREREREALSNESISNHL